MITLFQDCHFLHDSLLLLFLVSKNFFVNWLYGDQMLANFVTRQVDFSKSSTSQDSTNSIKVTWTRLNRPIFFEIHLNLLLQFLDVFIVLLNLGLWRCLGCNITIFRLTWRTGRTWLLEVDVLLNIKGYFYLWFFLIVRLLALYMVNLFERFSRFGLILLVNLFTKWNLWSEIARLGSWANLSCHRHPLFFSRAIGWALNFDALISGCLSLIIELCMSLSWGRRNSLLATLTWLEMLFTRLVINRAIRIVMILV